MANYTDVYEHQFKVTGQDALATAASKQGKALGQVGSVSARVKETFTALSPTIGQVGSELSSMSSEWAATYRNAQLVETRLEALGKHQGMSPEAIQSIRDMAAATMQKTGFKEDDILQAANTLMNWNMSAEQITRILPYMGRQARQTGDDIVSIANAIGKSYSAGSLGALKRARISVDDVSLAQNKALVKMTDWTNAQQVAALRATVFEGALKGIEQSALPLDAIMQSAAARSDLFAAKQEKLDELLGEGAGKYFGLRRQVLGLGQDLALAHPELTKTAGAAAAAGGGLLKGLSWVGGISHDLVSFRAALTLAKGGQAALTAATLADTAAETAHAGATNADTAATVRNGLASQQAAASKSLLARTSLAATGGLGVGGLLNAGAGAALGGSLGAGAMATSLGLAGLAAGGGWMAGSAIARGLNVGGAGDLAKANAATKDLERELGGSVGGAVSQEMLSRYRQARGIRARTTASGDLRVTIPGDQVMTAQAAQDYAMLE